MMTNAEREVLERRALQAAAAKLPKEIPIDAGPQTSLVGMIHEAIAAVDEVEREAQEAIPVEERISLNAPLIMATAFWCALASIEPEEMEEGGFVHPYSQAGDALLEFARALLIREVKASVDLYEDGDLFEF